MSKKTAYEEYAKLKKQNEVAQASEYASDELKKAYSQALREAKDAAEREAEKAKRERLRR